MNRSRALAGCRSWPSFAALFFFVSVTSAASRTGAQSSPLLLLTEPRSELREALEVEVASLGFQVLDQVAPPGATELDRAASALEAARSVGARAAIWVEQPNATGTTVEVIDGEKGCRRRTALPGPLAQLEPRVFAIVTRGLIEELPLFCTGLSPVASSSPASDPEKLETRQLQRGGDDAVLDVPAPRRVASAVPASAEGIEEERPRLFVQFGPSIGFGIAYPGMRADGSPDPLFPEDRQRFIPEGSPFATCPDNGDDFEDYCVRVDSARVVSTLAWRLTVGYHLTPRFAIAGTVRSQPDAGESHLASTLLGIRGQYVLFEPLPEGLYLAPIAGLGYGQIQLQTDHSGSFAPYAKSGLVSGHAGAVVGYRLIRNLGLTFIPQLDVLFPHFLFNLDFNLGVGAAF